MYAVIRAGGRQLRVSTGDVIEVDRLKADAGSKVTFTPVLIADGDTVKATPDQLSGAAVGAEVIGHKRGQKIRVFNYHAKTGWKKNKGHRSELTTVKITEIG